MPLSLPNKDKKKKKIDEVEERLSPKKVSDLSFSEARAIREQYGSLKNYELATDKNMAKRIDEQMQDLNARRLVDAATSRGTPVEAESYGKNNKWNDYTTVMSERKSDYDRAVEKLKKDLDVYSPIADVSGVKNYLDATKAGYDNAVALGKSAADFGNQFKSADDYKRWSIGWDESRTGDKNFEDTEETRKARKDYYDGLKEKRSRLEAERTAAEQELYDFRQSDAYKNANYGSDEEKQNINTETSIQSRIWQYDADLEALDADITRYERFSEVQDKYAKLREDPNFERYAEIEATHSGYGVDKNGNTISTGNNVVDNYFGVSEKYKDVNVTDPMFDAMYGVSDQERNLIEFGYDYSLDELTEEEKQTYRYLLSTQGADSADQFLEEMKPTLNRRAVQREANELKNASGWELAIRNIASIPQNILGGVTASIADVIQGDNKNPYDKWHRGAISASAVRGETAQRINNATGNANLLGFSLGDTYQALMSAADSAAGAALFGRAYTITMGAGAASSRAKELYENGASNNQILMSALASGLTEVVTEYVSVDKLVSNFLESTPKNKLDLILKMLSQGGIEASEEFAADILNTIQDNAILGSQSEWNKKLKEYMDGGMSREEAQQKVWLDTMGDALKSAAGGFVSGIAMGAPIAAANAVGNAIDTRREGRYVNENNGAEALQNLAREVAGAPNLTKAVDKVTKKASNKNVGKLSRALEQTIVNETDAETRSEKGAKYTLAREGVDLSDVKAREGTNLYNNVDVSEKVSDTGTTVDTETGGEITIDEKNPITQRDGKTYLNTSAGEILQDDIKYSSEKEAQLYEYVSDLPQSVANAIVENYKGQENVRGYVNGMRDGILLYGYNNIETVPSNTAFATLDKADQQYARQIGQTLAAEDLKVKPQTVGNHVAVKETATTSGERVMNLNEIGLKATPAVAKKIGAGGTAGAVYTKGDVDLNSAMGRADGLLAYVYSSIAGNSVVLYDSKTVKDVDLKNANGKHVASDGTIYLDIRAEAGNNVTGGIAYTLGHELTHEAEQWAKKEYSAFRKFLYENYIEKGTAVEDLIAKKMSDLDTTDRTYAESEVVADACERMLLDSDAMEKLAELRDKEPGTFKKIVDFIKRALEKIVGKFNSIREVYKTLGAENTRIESKLVQEFGDNLKKLQDMWSDMVVKAAQNRAAAVENNSLAYDFGASEQMAEEGSVQYSKVTDKKTLDFLNNQDYLRVFRAMALIDGKLYPPMATKVVKEGESKASLQDPTIIGEWYQSDERPDLADDKGRFPLRKPNGKTIWARYNPYWHTSATPLNDQFDEAHKRPELVVVEGIIPKSELTSGYKAYKAKDAVGATKWHSGEVAKQLKGAKARTVYLSRWFMAERVVPEAEVAKIIADTLRGENIYFPTNVVTPKLLEELRKTDVVLENSIDEKGNKIPEKVRKAARQNAEKSNTFEGKTSDQFSRKVTPEENARYMELAKDPAKNEAELQRMVEEAAREAGYTVKAYHQTGADFTVFSTDNPVAGANDSETPNGIFFKMNDHDIGLEGKKQMGVYLKTGKMLHFKNREQANDWYEKNVDEYQSLQNEMKANLTPFFDELDKIENLMFGNDVTDERYAELDEEWNRKLEEMRIVEDDYRGRLRELLNDYFLKNDSGYGSIKLDYDGHRYVDGKRENVETIIVFDRNQIKSADPVVYDNNGKVIPLEERFNPENDDIRYSYKGRSSLTTPTGSLNINDIRDKQGNENLKIAYKMDREGVDSEKIRLATGWFKGYDGKWRSEIDDSDAKLASWIILGKGKRYMEERARNNTGDLRDKVFALQDRLAKSNKSNGANSDESKALRKEIRQTKKQREAASDLEFKISQNRLNLSDILDHPKLYENYPQLKDAVVHLSYTDGNDLGGAWGLTVLGSDEITLATNLNSREDILGTLMHEIQHVIQGIEGFASGANVEYWAKRNKAESEDTRKAKLRLASVEDKLRNIDYNGNTAASPIKTAMSYAYIVDQLRTDKEGTANYDYDTEAKERYEERAKEGGYSDLLKEYLEAYQDVQIANMEAEDYPRAFADYQRTAGEIEARDVTGRLRMTEEERKAKRPDIDRNDVLFYSDQYSRKLSESYAVRDIVDRALKRLDPSSAEYRAMAKYKAELDTLDNMRAQLDEAIKNGDRQAQTRLTNNIKTQNGILARIENSNVTQNVTALKDVAKLTKDVKNLREMLRLQAKETGGTIASKTSAEAVAKELMDKYGVKRGKGELAGMISRLYTELISGVNDRALNVEYMRDLSRDAAEWIAEHQAKEYESDDAAQEVLDYLKGKKVWINDQQKSDIRHKYDGQLNKWMGRLSGYVTVTNDKSAMPLDDLWNDLSKQFPAEFGEVSDADQGWMLADKLSDLKERANHELVNHGLTDEQMEEWTDQVTDAVYESLWNIKPMETVADKYEKQITELKEKHRADMSALRKSFADTIREERSTMYAEAKERAREYGEKIDTRRKLKKLAERMKNAYENPKVNNYIPASLVKPTLEVLKELNFDTKRGSKLADAFGKLKLEYDALVKNSDGVAEYSDTISDLIEQMRQSVKGVRVQDMTREQLEDVYITLKAFDHVIRDARVIHGLGTDADSERNVYEVGEDWTNEILEAKDAKRAINKYSQKMLRPSEFFERLASYKKDSTSSQIYKMLNRAARKMAMIEMESNMMFSEILKDSKYVEGLSSLKDKNLVDIGLKDSTGKPIKITRGMMLAYYMHTLNEDNARHVAIGGLKAPNFKQYYNSKADAYSNGVRIPGLVGKELAAQYEKILDTLEGEKNKKGVRTGGLNEEIQEAIDRYDQDKVEQLLDEKKALYDERDAIIERGMQMVDEIRKTIENKLSDKDRAFIKAAQDYFGNYSKNVLNEATMRMYGFEKARVENYFPIHSDANFLKAAFETVARDASLENKGFMKDRVKAANPIMLEDFASVINSQIGKTAQYAAFAPALREFGKIYSTKTGGVAADNSVMEAVSQKFGQAGLDYLSNLVADMNGARRRDVSFLDKARGKYAQAVLTLNPKVSLAQAASYPSAAAVVGYKALVKALAAPDGNVVLKKADKELIAKYTARLWQRNRGGADVTLHDAKSINNLYNRVNSKLRFLTGWIEMVDAGTVGRLWYASEYYVRDNFKDLERGSDAYYEKTAEVFNKVVEETQPNYTVLQRPDILRNPNQLVRSLFMFMTQRLQNFNILYGAARRYAKYSSDLKNNGRNGVTKEDVGEARLDLWRAASSQLLAAGSIAGLKLLADVLLHNIGGRRRDKDTGEITKKSLWLSVVDDFTSSLVSDVLGGSEAYSAIKAIATGGKYYNPSIGGIDTITNLITNSVNLAQKIADPDKDASTSDYTKLGFSVAELFGISAKNGYAIGNGLWNHAQDIKNGKFGSFDAGYEIKNKQYANRMYNAIEAGDEKAFKEAWDSTKPNKGSTVDETAAKNLTDAIGDRYKKGEIDADTAEEYLTEYCGKTETDARRQTERWDYAEEHGDMDGYKIYNDLYEAVKTGKGLKAEIKRLHNDLGCSREAINGALNDYFSPIYAAASPGERANMKGYLLNAYELLGYDRDNKSKTIDGWADPEKQKESEEKAKEKEEEFEKLIRNY